MGRRNKGELELPRGWKLIKGRRMEVWKIFGDENTSPPRALMRSFVEEFRLARARVCNREIEGLNITLIHSRARASEFRTSRN